jgi:hypothetical protein
MDDVNQKIFTTVQAYIAFISAYTERGAVMFKRVMITLLCITAITMLVTEANAVTCPAGFIEIGGSCLQLWSFQLTKGGSQVPGEVEAELATMINAVPSRQPGKVEIVGNTDLAKMVKKKLIQFGLQPDLIEVKGYAPGLPPRTRTRPVKVPMEVKMIVPPLP